jgi:hypothetical protein
VSVGVRSSHDHVTAPSGQNRCARQGPSSPVSLKAPLLAKEENAFPRPDQESLPLLPLDLVPLQSAGLLRHAGLYWLMPLSNNENSSVKPSQVATPLAFGDLPYRFHQFEVPTHAPHFDKPDLRWTSIIGAFFLPVVRLPSVKAFLFLNHEPNDVELQFASEITEWSKRRLRN